MLRSGTANCAVGTHGSGNGERAGGEKGIGVGEGWWMMRPREPAKCAVASHSGEKRGGQEERRHL